LLLWTSRRRDGPKCRAISVVITTVRMYTELPYACLMAALSRHSLQFPIQAIEVDVLELLIVEYVLQLRLDFLHKASLPYSSADWSMFAL